MPPRPVAECAKCHREWGITVDGAHAVALTGPLGDHAEGNPVDGFYCCERRLVFATPKPITRSPQ